MRLMLPARVSERPQRYRPGEQHDEYAEADEPRPLRRLHSPAGARHRGGQAEPSGLRHGGPAHVQGSHTAQVGWDPPEMVT